MPEIAQMIQQAIALRDALSLELVSAEYTVFVPNIGEAWQELYIEPSRGPLQPIDTSLSCRLVASLTLGLRVKRFGGNGASTVLDKPQAILDY